MTANLNMRNMQETVEDTSKKAMELGRKAYLAYIGAWGMGYDGVKAVATEPMAWVSKAEQRGKSVEKEFMKVFQAYQKDFPGEVTKLAENVQHTAADLAKSAEKTFNGLFGDATETVEEIAVEAKAAVSNVNGGTRKATAAVSEMAAEQVEKIQSAIESVWTGYDDLGVKDIVAGLESKKLKELEKVREYELGSKNRVTVLREIDARLQAMTS